MVPKLGPRKDCNSTCFIGEMIASGHRAADKEAAIHWSIYSPSLLKFEVGVPVMPTLPSGSRTKDAGRAMYVGTPVHGNRELGQVPNQISSPIEVVE